MSSEIITNSAWLAKEIPSVFPKTDVKELGKYPQPVRKCVRFPGGIIYDPNLRYLRTNKGLVNIPLTWVQTIMFESFLDNAGNIVSYDNISSKLYSEYCINNEAIWTAKGRLVKELDRIPDFNDKLRNVKGGFSFNVKASDKLIHPAPIVFDREFSYDFSSRELKKKNLVSSKEIAKRPISSPTISFIWETLITNPNKIIAKEYWLENLRRIKNITHEDKFGWWVIVSRTRKLINCFSPEVASRIITRGKMGLEYKTSNI
ncbi:MAG TPA: hypothetical protein VJ399_00960 [Patescibacteria group bacterium]|nr:hypothetical protein [Patescibacteria group bacterium]